MTDSDTPSEDTPTEPPSPDATTPVPDAEAGAAPTTEVTVPAAPESDTTPPEPALIEPIAVPMGAAPTAAPRSNHVMVPKWAAPMGPAIGSIRAGSGGVVSDSGAAGTVTSVVGAAPASASGTGVVASGDGGSVGVSSDGVSESVMHVPPGLSCQHGRAEPIAVRGC